VSTAGAHSLPEDPDQQPHRHAPARHRIVERVDRKAVCNIDAVDEGSRASYEASPGSH
jgi:hypothetical protein